MIWNNNKVVNCELQWMAEVYKSNFNKNKLTRSSYPSNSYTGTQDKRFFPFLPNSDFLVPSGFTISPICGCSANWLSPGIPILYQ